MARDLVWIKIFPDEAAAARMRDLLRANGIESFMSCESHDGASELPSRSPWHRLGVRADDVRVALTLAWGRPGA